MRARRGRRIVHACGEQGAGKAPRVGMQDRIAKRRQVYAAEITRRAGVRDPRIEKAFTAVPREEFAGPPPWRIGSGGVYGRVSDSDPASLYDDVLVAIDAGRGINNGQPSLHALCIDALGVKEGETVVHVGAGAGYYTAILAYLVGPTGRVVAYEIEPNIAERARANLARFPQVEVRARSGVDEAPPKADCIYVNAAATHPVRAWLDALNVGGRLLFPLQAAHSTGDMLLITRPEQGYGWPARFLSGVVFIACVGAQDAAAAQRACARCVSAPRRRGRPGCKATAGRCRPRRRNRSRAA
jgi:protein-L-isoaspartate(D-aspartate) O-methyltransferase